RSLAAAPRSAFRGVPGSRSAAQCRERIDPAALLLRSFYYRPGDGEMRCPSKQGDMGGHGAPPGARRVPPRPLRHSQSGADVARRLRSPPGQDDPGEPRALYPATRISRMGTLWALPVARKGGSGGVLLGAARLAIGDGLSSGTLNLNVGQAVLLASRLSG